MPIPNRTLSLALAAAFATALPMGDIRAAPLSSAFTYQGELYDTGQPLVGSVDLRFTPYADATNPAVLGPPVVVENVVVSDGVFTAKVDFGPGFFVKLVLDRRERAQRLGRKRDRLAVAVGG